MQSSRDSALNHTRWEWVVLFIVIIALAIMSRVGLLAWPFLNDSGLYAALGRTVATGGVMYRDFYETKLPGAGLIAAGFWTMFGSHWIGYVLCELGMALLAAGALARAVGQRAGHAAMLPTLLFAVVFLNFDYAVYTGFQLETIQAFFEALSAVAALKCLGEDDRSAAFTAGLLAGCAAMAKPGGAGVAIALMICLLRRRPLWILPVIAGLSVPTLGTVYYTVHSGAWPFLPGAIRDIARYASGTPMRPDALVKVCVVLGVLGWPFAVLVVVSGKKATGDTVLRTVSEAVERGVMEIPTTTPLGSNDSVRKIRSSLLLLFASLWFVFDLTAAVAQRRLYPYHFLPLACPGAMLYGLLRPQSPIRVALGLLPIAVLSLTWEGSSLSHLDRGFHRTAVADYIAAHTTTTDAIFADQMGRLLIETDRKPGSRLGTFFYLVNSDSAPQDYCRVLLEDFKSRHPKYLVLTEGWDRDEPGLANCEILSECPTRRASFLQAWKSIRKYVTTHYEKMTTLEGMEIYRIGH